MVFFHWSTDINILYCTSFFPPDSLTWIKLGVFDAKTLINMENISVKLKIKYYSYIDELEIILAMIFEVLQRKRAFY